MASDAGKDSKLAEYVKKHGLKEKGVLAEAIKAACDADAPNAIEFIGQFMLNESSSDSKDGVAAYAKTSAFGVARQRTGWLLFFLFGLLHCANVMKEFEELLARELELAFFVPLLIGHGGNSGGQTVATVIRALGSGAVKLSDCPRIVFKEASAGVMQAVVLACVLAPSLHLAMGISLEVTQVVALTLPSISLIANTVGAALPFVVTYFGHDPAVIVSPLMTTSVDSFGLGTYLGIATLWLTYMKSGPQCEKRGRGCFPSDACKMQGGTCVAK
jgi:Mg/Co/Ni transporter MgtE